LPELIIIAGPNGSGKSTLTKINQFNCPIIDPDAIAREVSVETTANLQIQAGKRSLELWNLYLAENRSFVVETTLSGKIHLKKMKEFKDNGWLVRLFFIGLESPEINVLRVTERVRKGGHDVPITDIYRRYQRSIENLKKAAAIADTTIIYDNSTAEGHRLIATIEQGILTLQTTECPQWFQNNYGNP
jgi:predicted ABC-type ATPase